MFTLEIFKQKWSYNKAWVYFVGVEIDCNNLETKDIHASQMTLAALAFYLNKSLESEKIKDYKIVFPETCIKGVSGGKAIIGELTEEEKSEFWNHFIDPDNPDPTK